MWSANPRSPGIAAAAALEIPTGAVLLTDPALFSRLLFGAGMTPAGLALGRMTGFALLAFAMACWPRNWRNGDEGSLRALLLFSFLTASYLLYVGVAGELVGILLWPATATHFAFAIVLARSWIKGRARREQHIGTGGHT